MHPRVAIRQRRRAPVVAILAALALVTAACGSGDGTDYDVTLTPETDDTGVARWPLRVDMSAEEALVIEPAGDVHEDAGHFHVMLSGDCVEPGEPIPNDAQHRHFGDASTTATLAELPPGEHELCLQVADGAHTALDATDVVTVEVGEVAETAWQRAVNRACQAMGDEIQPLFDEFFATWGDELENGAGPDDAEADAILADWYAAVDEITAIYGERVGAALALPAPASFAEKVDEITATLEEGLATIADMSERQDPAFLWGESDEDFPLDRLFTLFAELKISDCEGNDESE